MSNDQPDPSCEWCHRPIYDGWSFCAYCGEAIFVKDDAADKQDAEDACGILKD